MTPDTPGFIPNVLTSKPKTATSNSCAATSTEKANVRLYYQTSAESDLYCVVCHKSYKIQVTGIRGEIKRTQVYPRGYATAVRQAFELQNKSYEVASSSDESEHGDAPSDTWSDCDTEEFFDMLGVQPGFKPQGL